ncbi:MAG: Tex family protein [Chitinophagaceae bacterium]
MRSDYIHHISKKSGFSLKQISNIFQLHTLGSTIPFIARYRKEATGNMDEVQINEVIELINTFTELDKRKETVLKTIEGMGKLTPELKQKIQNSYDPAELEDVYLPYKPKRKTRAVAAMEKGLEPLARMLFEQTTGNRETEAAKYINEQVKDINEALQGALDIMAEWVSEHEQARSKIRQLYAEAPVLSAKVMASKKEVEDAQKYRDYFDFSEPLNRCPSHRLLAIRRGEKEGFLLMNISIDRQVAIDALNRIFVRPSGIHAGEVNAALEDGYDRLLQPSIENEFRLVSKNKADEEAIKVFAENLRQLLLSPPLGSMPVLALDPGFRSGCKMVCLDEQGNLLHETVIYPHPPQHQVQDAIDKLIDLVDRYNIQAIGIGNGTAGRETEKLVRGIDFGRKVSIYQVNESGASIYSASELAREEFPDFDVTVRGAISIGRRLLDPLSELVKIDAKSIGVGQYQHDVNQTRLKDSLDKVVESCVNHVGVDLNTASRHLLMYVSGLSTTLARNIVDYRAANGAFKSRAELKKVSLMGPKSFEQCAGFLRIPHGTNVLDNSGVHPESYHVVKAMAKDAGCTVEELVSHPGLRRQITIKNYVSETIGVFTIGDILKELEKPGRDPRTSIEEFRFDETVKSIEDVKSGMTVPGIVTNITSFGAFVDIGVKQDGLVHISQLSNTFVTDPNTVVKLQQRVMVTVTEVDVARKRIALSMKTASTSHNMKQDEQKAKTEPAVKGNMSKIDKAQPVDPFQAKLMELKKRFD